MDQICLKHLSAYEGIFSFSKRGTAMQRAWNSGLLPQLLVSAADFSLRLNREPPAALRCSSAVPQQRRASAALLGSLAVAAVFLGADVDRVFLAEALPLGTVPAFLLGVENHASKRHEHLETRGKPSMNTELDMLQKTSWLNLDVLLLSHEAAGYKTQKHLDCFQ